MRGQGLGRELRHAARSFLRSPGFTLAAAGTLALGIGVNAAVFSFVNASLLRPLPFEEPAGLVAVQQMHAAAGEEPQPFPWWSYGQVEALGPRLTTLSQLAGYYAADANLSAGGVDPVRGRIEIVSAAYFSALRVRPEVGRVFLPSEDSVPGAHPVAVLSHELWGRGFGADPEVVGRDVVVDGVALTVVGVAPPGFRGLTGGADLWTPHAMAPSVHFPEYLTSDQYFIALVGRLRPGVTLEEARSEVAVSGARAAAGVRAAGRADDWAGDWGADVVSLAEARRDPVTVRAQLVLAGAALVVLLLAVVNLSGLLLGRSTARAGETAVRAALGADRRRLVRHGLVEGGLLGVLGGGAGMLLAAWSVRALAAFAPEHLGGARPRLSRAGLASFAEPVVDWRVTAFAAALALAAGLLAGLVPALRATGDDLMRTLRTGARGISPGIGSLRRPTGLYLAATAQLAGALVLLVAAGMLIQGFNRLRSVDPGFDADGLFAFRISPPEHVYDGAARVRLLEQVLDRVQAVPGVVAATVGCAPYERCSWAPLYVEGRTPLDPAPYVGRIHAGPDHFRALGIPLLRGRALTVGDRPEGARVAVVNETASRRFWPGEDPVGKRVWFAGAEVGSTEDATEIVGVVGDVLYGSPADEVQPDFYSSYLQAARPQTTVIVRVRGDPGAAVPPLRRAVADVDPGLPLHDVRRIDQRAAEVLASERFATALLVVFAGLALALACLGVYGIMAYSVSQRRKEIGIRLAVGATENQVLRQLMGQGAALAGAGLAIGAVAAVGLSRGLPALIAGVDVVELPVLAAVSVILLIVALFACWIPARAATRVDPMVTMAPDTS